MYFLNDGQISRQRVQIFILGFLFLGKLEQNEHENSPDSRKIFS